MNIRKESIRSRGKLIRYLISDTNKRSPGKIYRNQWKYIEIKTIILVQLSSFQFSSKVTNLTFNELIHFKKLPIFVIF